MKFAEFLKDYLHCNYGLLWRAIIVSLVIVILPPNPAWMHSIGENAKLFLIAFAVYCAVDVLFEWFRCRYWKGNK